MTEKEKSGQQRTPAATSAAPGTETNGAGNPGLRSVPRDAHAIMAIFKEFGASEFDPKCVTQLLEFAHRYVIAVLEDARAFANHAKKKTIEADDVRLAAAAHAERAFSTPPPREVLLELTRGKNSTPLPLIKPYCGLRLPPDRFCLSASNYRLGRAKKPKAAPAPAPAHSVHGAKRPGTLMTVSKTQTVSVPKPVFKFSSAGKPATKTVKSEYGSENAFKRKREDGDDYDAVQ